MQNNQQGDGGMAPNIPKPLLQMQSLDALLQSSHMQSSLLQHQYRQNQALQQQMQQQSEPTTPTSLIGQPFRHHKTPEGSPTPYGHTPSPQAESPANNSSTEPGGGNSTKSPVSDVKVKLEGRGGGAGKTMVVVAGTLSNVRVKPISNSDEMIWQKAWSTKFPSAPTHSYPTLASWIIKRLNNRITGRWTDIASGRFDLEWKETAESWYHQRPRRSCPNDAPHLLHKGLLAAFPNLIETRRETIARQSCVKREFKMPDDVCQQVAIILESIIKNGGVAPSESYGNMVSYRRRSDLYSVDDEKMTELRTLRTEDGKVETVRVHPLVPKWPEEYVDGQYVMNNDYLSPHHFPPLITHIDSGKIVNSGKQQLTELHGWASNLESFQSLSGTVRKALFTNSVTLLLLIKFAYRSSKASAKQLQDGTKSCYNPNESTSEVVQKVGKLLLDKLVSPMQDLITTEEELGLFMSIILYDSSCETLDDETEKVNEFRAQSCSALEAKLTEKGKNLSDMLLLYPPLCTVRSAIIEHLSLVELVGEASELRNNARDIMSSLVG